MLVHQAVLVVAEWLSLEPHLEALETRQLNLLLRVTMAVQEQRLDQPRQLILLEAVAAVRLRLVGMAHLSLIRQIQSVAMVVLELLLLLQAQA